MGALLALTIGCSDAEGDAAQEAVVEAPTETSGPSAGSDPVVSDPVVSEPGSGTAGAGGADGGGFPVTFERVVPGGDCQCADGSEFSFYVREADPTKVLLFFQGGGACFSALTCAFENGAYKVTTGAGDDPTGEDGIFDLTDERNPFRDHSIVFVPYCTGDVHLGTATTKYGSSTVQHKGAVNGRAALAEMVARFGDAGQVPQVQQVQQVVVAGESAGAVPTPLFAGLVADEFPDARVIALADGSGAYPDVPAVNELIGGLWGTVEAIPDWPVNEGLTAADWSFPDLFVQAGRHAPDVVFARHDYAYDRTQAFFALLAGVGADDLLTQIDANEEQIESAGVPLFTYLSPGDDHTVLSSRDFFTEQTGDTSLVEWVTALVDGGPVDDQRCEDCRTP